MYGHLITKTQSKLLTCFEETKQLLVCVLRI
nr:MAG TPA: hypothetical protein [Caudoviricetes sp.]